MRSWRPDFFEENNKKATSAYVHLEGLAKSFSLTCSSLQSWISWTRGLVSYLPMVFFPSAHGEFFFTLRPHYFNRNDSFKSKYECNLWSICWGLSFDILAIENGPPIWVQAFKPRVLKLFCQLSERATILGWRPIFFDDLVKAVTNVSTYRDIYQ